MTSPPFDHLSNNLIRQAALSLPFSNIKALCLTSHKFNDAVCKYQIFWYNKLVHDYGGTIEYSDTLDWKQIYRSRLIGLGSNGYGQLGLGSIFKINELTYVPTPPFKDIACGVDYTIIIDINGNLWGTGKNNTGQLGIDTGQEKIVEYTQLTHDLKFIQVACGSNHTLALSGDGRIWVTGSNDFDLLRLKQIDQVKRFTELEGYQAKQISCGGHHSAFIDLDGNLYTFGHKTYGRLGRDGDNAIPGKVSIPGNIPVIQVACGSDHMACIDDNHDIWAFGRNDYGQLGLVRNKSSQRRHPVKIRNHKAKYVSCGYKQTAFIDLNDNVWIFGKIYDAGLQIFVLQSVPRKITQVYHQGQTVDMDFRVKQVYCGFGAISFIDLENNLWVSGYDNDLDIESEVPIMLPRIKAYKAAIGGRHMVIMGYSY